MFVVHIIRQSIHQHRFAFYIFEKKQKEIEIELCLKLLHLEDVDNLRAEIS